jgi:hypothetical protein
MSRKKHFISILLAVTVVVGLVCGSFYLGRQTVQPTNKNRVVKYPLLADRVLGESPKNPLINFSLLRNDLEKYFTDNHLTGSMYFEYLHTGTQVRVNGDEEQAAASLLKVPLAMELYKAAELQKIDIHQQITLKEDELDSAYGTLYQKGAGYSLTLEEAAKIMLHDSDNTALKAIADTIDGLIPTDEGVFSYLDADITQGEDLSVAIGARSYSSILKCLYFACYINNDDSELLLGYLTETNFNNRLIAGIDDKSIRVAHKIGVFQDKTQSDCGIVYLPDRPYVFCAMINGQDNDATNQHIANLSRKAYDYVKNAK